MSIIKRIIPQLIIILIGCLCSYGQESIIKTDRESKNFLNHYLDEKLFAHTDKNLYMAGEILWFKLYYVDGTLHNPLDISKLAYVEVLDKESKPVLQSKIALNEGSGSGSFYVPVSLQSGVYRFRAYTQWMKNFPADYFFEKDIRIVNSMKNMEPQTPQNNAYDIGFFPEGGDLVQGLESKVAFRTVDRSGNGQNYEGIVINQHNDTVVSFQPLKFGIGHFMFTPKPGETYKAIIRINDTLVTREMPISNEQGFVMYTSNEGESKIRVKVSTNTSSTEPVHLLVQQRHAIKFSEKKSISSGTADFIIDKSSLGEGISQFTVFSNAKQAVCERLYFIRPSKQLLIETSGSEHQYSSRNQVLINVFTKEETGNPIPANLSVSVFKVDGFSASETKTITNYFWLTSDLKGNIESPGYYLSNTSAEVTEAVDNLMLTHGWRRFRLDPALNVTSIIPENLPEYRGHIITGIVTNTKTGLPASGILTYLSVPGKRVQLYSSKSDSVGRIRFYTTDFYGPNEILLQTDTRYDSTYHLEISNPFSEKFSSNQFPIFVLADTTKNSLVDNSVSAQVQNVFAMGKLNRFYTPLVDSSAFYGPPDNSYNLDNYVRFSTMEEVLREYVFEVLVRRHKENFRLIMYGGLENKIFIDDPLTLFNGVPVFETNKIIQYDPLKVQHIEIMQRRYFYGPSTMNGIVNFTTYQPDPVMVSSLNGVVFDYEGMQFNREFYSPVYETQDQRSSRFPDFRNVLYWSPDIKTNEHGKGSFSFYTSDEKGSYVVELEGMNSDGKIGNRFFLFTVK